MNVFDVFRHWETDLRPYTLEALGRMTPEQLKWKPAGWHSSSWDLAVHMCGCEWIWIYRNVLKKAPWGTRWEDDRFAGLVDLLPFWDEIHQETIQWLKETKISDLEKNLPMPYEGSYNVHWVTYHVVEHEIHHRGQIFMLMRMQGIEPPEI